MDSDFVVKLNNLQENMRLHMANKLIRQHINCRNSIMKVKLATQNVADTLRFCRADLELREYKIVKQQKSLLSS